MLLLLSWVSKESPPFLMSKKVCDNTWWRVPSNVGCRWRLGETRWGLLLLVGLGNLTAWPDAPYCSQGRGGSDGGLRWEGPSPWQHLKRWDCAEGVWVRTELGAVGGHQAGPALARPLLKITGPLGSHMWTTFLLLFLLIALPWDTLAASHLFIHLQPLFQMWNSGLKPVFCFKVDGMSVLSWSPSPSLGLLWLCWTPSWEQAFGSCSVLRSEDSLRKGPCEHWGVYLHARVCAYLWCVFFSSITPPANFQLFHSLCSLSLNKFIPILWNISSLNPQECSDSIWASGIS